MRFEATLPDSRGTAALQLAEELGLTRSQLLDEALSLFLKVVLEVRRGRKLMTFDPLMSKPACEIATASITALEWAGRPQKLELSAAAIARIQELNDEPPEPTAQLRRAAKRYRDRPPRKSD